MSHGENKTRQWTGWLALACVLALGQLVGCTDGDGLFSETAGATEATSSTPGTSEPPGAGGGGADAEPPLGTGGSTSSGAGGAADPDPSGLPDLGSLVVLGDSIGAGGGEGPFYYDELLALLEVFYAKTIHYVNHAQAGSTTMALEKQIAALPAELPGPVAVVITSGGNNMIYSSLQIMTGLDQLARDRMGGHIDGALSALLVPDRFGSGVTVHVLEANIYDASDGQGNFGSGGCAVLFNVPSGSAAIFDSWNAVIADQVTAHGQTLIDIHASFTGHGFNSPPSWYVSDCVHPNVTGHGMLTQSFATEITGAP
ncbi:MAG: SGNH/GDSL hydrolase family protein [Deltaproteobacteria bacterium]|nr:SGNH/GDSL hydrolase family protein [Deltaproteobacteria bacterium]